MRKSLSADVRIDAGFASTGVLCRVFRLFDRAELHEGGEEIGRIARFRDLPVSKPIEADPTDRYFLLCR